MAAYRRSFAMRCMMGSCCATGAVALLLFLCGADLNLLRGQTELSSSESLTPELRDKLQQRANLMLRDVTLVEAMFIIQQQWDVNIVIGNDAKEPVNGSYENAPLHEILDTLLGSRDYGYRIVGNSLVVMKRSELSQIKPLFETVRIPLQHVPPDQVQDLILVLLSPGGRAHAVPSANSVIVMDYPERIAEIRERLMELDEAAAEAERQAEEEQRAAEQAAQQRTIVNSVDPTIVGARNTTPRIADANQDSNQDDSTEDSSTPSSEDAAETEDTSDDPNQSDSDSTDPSADTAPVQQQPAPNRTVPGTTATQPGANVYGPQSNSAALNSANTGDPLSDAPLLERAYFRPQYVEASAIVASLATFVSEYGQVTAIPEENRIVAIDDHEHLMAIAEAVKELDCIRDQVRITALIFDASIEDVENIGVNLTNALRGRNLNAAGAAQDQINIGTLLAPAPGANAVNGAFTLMSLSQNADITAVIRLLRESNKSELLADPTVVVQDRESARIAIVTEIPYQQLTESAQGGAIGTTAFREAGVTLQVTPRIAADGTVNMVVTPEFSVLTGFTEDDQPIIARREEQTVVRVANQQTLVLGGLRQKSTVRTRAAIPGISRVPYVGALFRQRNDECRESELLVFITPTIVSAEHFGTPREQRAFDRSQCELEKVREGHCQRCQPPEDKTIYTNADFGMAPVYIETEHGPGRGTAPFESLPNNKSDSGREQSNIRLPATRRAPASGTQSVTPSTADPPLPPPPDVPTTSTRRNQQRSVASNASVVARALPVQEAKRAEIHPQRTRRASFPEEQKISAPQKKQAPAPVTERPLPKFRAPAAKKKVNPHQPAGGMTKPIVRQVIKVDDSAEESEVSNPRTERDRATQKLDGYFDL